MKTIAIVGTFDTKGREFRYVKKLVEDLGCKAFTIHTGVFEPLFEPDVSNREVAAAAGYNIDEIAARKDRALATEALSKGTEILIPQLYAEGKFDGIISCGGSGGTSLATPAMRALPIGVPKVTTCTTRMPPWCVISSNTEFRKAVDICIILDFQMCTGHPHTELVAQFLSGQFNTVENSA